MQVRQVHPVIAVLIAGSFLTACSGVAESDEAPDTAGGGQAGQQDHNARGDRVDRGGGGASGDGGVDRPDIEVAESLELAFEKPATEDPVELAILGDNEWHIRSVYEVLTTYDTDNSAIGFYTRGAALADAVEFIDDEMRDGMTSTGRMDFFNREVTSVNGEVALVGYCRDITAVSPMEFETGEVLETTDVEIPPEHFVSRLERNDAGIWQTVTTRSEEESPKCE